MINNLMLRVLLILLAIQLTACSPEDKTNTSITDSNKAHTAQCIDQQSQCLFDLDAGQVQVLFDVDKIVAEQSFNMTINYQGTEILTNISGYLEGVDMFMGKIPLFIEADLSGDLINNPVVVDTTPALNNMAQLKQGIEQEIKQVFQAEVLVGSCSAQQMTWRIWLTFTTSENKKYTKMLTVVSYRS